MRWLHRLRPATEHDGAGLAGASEAQALPLELAQRDEAVRRLEAELRRAQSASFAETVEAERQFVALDLGA